MSKINGDSGSYANVSRAQQLPVTRNLTNNGQGNEGTNLEGLMSKNSGTSSNIQAKRVFIDNSTDGILTNLGTADKLS